MRHVIGIDGGTESLRARVFDTAGRDLGGAAAGPVSAEWMIPKALWLKRHERALYDRAATLCEYQDFMVRRLTGRNVASLNNVSIRWHYRNGGGGWPDSLLAAIDSKTCAPNGPPKSSRRVMLSVRSAQPPRITWASKHRRWWCRAASTRSSA